MIKLYYYAGSCALGSHIALEESGAKYEAIEIDFATRTYGDGQVYLSKNPKGTVPFLELDNGETITQSGAVLTYIGEHVDQTGQLMPKHFMDKIKVHEALHVAASDIHASAVPVFRGITSAIPFYNEKLLKFYKFIDEALGKHDYIVPSGYSVADMYLFGLTSWFLADWIPFPKKKPVDLNKYSNLKNWFERMMQKPAVKQVIKDEGIQLDSGYEL